MTLVNGVIVGRPTAKKLRIGDTMAIFTLFYWIVIRFAFLFPAGSQGRRVARSCFLWHTPVWILGDKREDGFIQQRKIVDF